MQARYIGVWKLHGANKLVDGSSDAEFATLENPEIKATITAEPEPYFFHIDRSAALGVQLLKSLFAPDKAGTPEERLAAETENIRTNRANRTETGVFVIFEGATDIDVPEFRAHQDTDEFGVCLDSVDKPEIRETFQSFIQAHLTALGISLKDNADRRIEKVGDVVYLVDPENDKPIYAFTMQAGAARASIANPLSQDVITQAAARAPHLMTDRAMVRPVNLLITSLDQSTNELQAFIAAWAALEIFINATFKATYKARWFEVLEHGAPDPVRPVFKRLDEVMGDKYGLANKFLIIASLLDDAAADVDATEFRKLKDIRDNLLHALDAPAHLPIEATQNLLLKYMKLHFDR